MSYGIANVTGQASLEDVMRMLDLAQRAGVDTLDTARAYGESEAVIGQALAEGAGWRVVTKIDPSVCAPEITAAAVEAGVLGSLELSLHLLGRETLDVVLLHRPEHRLACGGAAWRALSAARASGQVDAIGVSATSPETALEAVSAEGVEVMQVATSLIDRRLVTQGFFELAAAHEVEVHLRSVFLQGVAFMAPSDLPQHLAPIASSLERIDAWAERQGVGRSTVFLAYALSLPVARIVIGCEHSQQLEENLAKVSVARALTEGVGELAQSLPVLPDAVLDPSQWRLDA